MVPTLRAVAGALLDDDLLGAVRVGHVHLDDLDLDDLAPLQQLEDPRDDQRHEEHQDDVAEGKWAERKKLRSAAQAALLRRFLNSTRDRS